MIICLLLAAGKSQRFGKQDKLRLPISGKSMRKWSFDVFSKNSLIKKIFVIRRTGKLKGGKTRQESVFRALQFLKKNPPEFLLIHNAANPFVTEDEIFRCAYFLQKHRTLDGVAVGRKIAKTVKMVVLPNIVEKTLDRNFLWETETPQLVRFKPFLDAHEKAKKEHFEATDDIALLEWAGRKTAVIEASPNNFKISTPRDYELAKIMVGDIPHNVRVGMAEDTHFFSRKHRGLYLAGVHFPKFQKLEANSDGDVCLHAIASAISQALGKNSLGTFSDRMYRQGIKDSKKYLEKIFQEMGKENFKIQHLGLHFEGQKPKIDPLASQLRSSLSNLLQIQEGQIGITAETGEKISEVSKNNGLRCRATVTLRY